MNNIEHFNKNHDAHGRFTFGSGGGGGLRREDRRTKKALKKEQVRYTLTKKDLYSWSKDDETIKEYGGPIFEHDLDKYSEIQRKVINNTKNKKLIEARKKVLKEKYKNKKNIKDVIAYPQINYKPHRNDRSKDVWVTNIKMEKIYNKPFRELAKKTGAIATAGIIGKYIIDKKILK